MHYKKLKIFVASPSDVGEERKRLKRVIDELNDGDADKLGWVLQLKEWSQVAPAMGRAEDVILREMPVESWDIFIGILWLRFGTATGGVDPQTGQAYGSGTEEEFKLAYRSWKELRKPDIMFYRKRSRTSQEEGASAQFRLVQHFFEDFEPTQGTHPGLYQHFDTPDDFERMVREHLTAMVWKIHSENVDDKPEESLNKNRENKTPDADKLSNLGLVDEDDESFGKSEFTAGLGYMTFFHAQMVPATYYVMLAALPFDTMSLSSIEVRKATKNMLEMSRWYDPQGDINLSPKYYPPTIFNIPNTQRSTRKAIILEEKNLRAHKDLVFSRLVITGSAEVVFAQAIRFVSVLENGIAIFQLGSILANCWRLSGLVAQLYKEIGYSGRTYFYVALINTLNSHLGGVANMQDEPEILPLYWVDAEIHDWSCHSRNLKLCRVLDLMKLKPKEQPDFIKQFAEDIAFEYNQEVPRFFEKTTGLIPKRYFQP